MAQFIVIFYLKTKNLASLSGTFIYSKYKKLEKKY